MRTTIFPTLLLLAACQPRSATPATAAPAADPTIVVAPTEHGEPARVEFRVAGTPTSNWNPFVRAAQDSVFQMTGFDYSMGRMGSESYARGVSFSLGLQALGDDSTIVAVYGQRYTGISPRSGYYPMGTDVWQWIATDDAEGVALLRAEASHLRDEAARERRVLADELQGGGAIATLAPGGAGTEPNPDSIVRRLSSGVLGYCRAGHVLRDHNLDSLVVVDVIDAPEWCPLFALDKPRMAGNTWVLRDPRAIAVGDTVGVCARALFLQRVVRFETVAEYTDPKHCRFDPFIEQQHEPNMVLLRRVE